MKARQPRSAAQAGFSLVELMVASLMGLILTAGVVSVYLASRKDYGLNNALGAVQKNGQSALDLLEPKIRMAGFFGCDHDHPPQSILNTQLTSYSSAASLQGYEYIGTGMGEKYTLRTAAPGTATDAGAWSPALPPDIGAAVGLGSADRGGAVPGSDMLLLHEAAPEGVSLADPYTDSDGGLFVATGQDAPLKVGELAIISDCRHANLFQITGIGASTQNADRERIEHAPDAGLDPGNAPPGEFGADGYGEGAQILPFGTYLIYVGSAGDRRSSLYEVSLRDDGSLGKPVERVPGVQSMQLLYGVDSDDDAVPNRFLTADQVDDWNRVVCVRIALLMQSDESFSDATGTASFSLLDPSRGLTARVAADGRLRRVFEETVSLRNRLP